MSQFLVGLDLGQSQDPTALVVLERVIPTHVVEREQELPRESALLEEIGQIQLASQRAAGLTRQLLAFSRKQILSPTVLSLNDLIENLRKMLERLIGEDITLTTVLDPQLWPVIAEACGDARNSTMGAMSFGSTRRPMGKRRMKLASASASLTPPSSFARAARRLG